MAGWALDEVAVADLTEMARMLGQRNAIDAQIGCRLRHCLLEVADSLGEPGRQAVAVPGTLRQLGPGVEQVVARLAPNWTLPISQVPDVANRREHNGTDRRGRTSSCPAGQPRPGQGYR